jgi:hypothetical protein
MRIKIQPKESIQNDKFHLEFKCRKCSNTLYEEIREIVYIDIIYNQKYNASIKKCPDCKTYTVFDLISINESF